MSLDSPQYAQPDTEEAFAAYLAKRLQAWQPDLVVPNGAPAGRFVAKFRNRLFAEDAGALLVGGYPDASGALHEVLLRQMWFRLF